MREGFLSRSRKFNPQTLFLSILHLVASTNRDGYLLALQRTWQRSGLKLKHMPAKSSLSEYREKVSAKFFQDVFEEDFERFNPTRKTFRGYYVYAIDGDHFDLPASEGVISCGYRGFPYSKKEETYYPKMYTVQAVDLINGVVARFSESSKVSEVLQARAIIPTLEKNSITIYDRLHQCYETAAVHEEIGSYFFVRVKVDNPKLNCKVRDFCRSPRRSEWIDLHPSPPLKRKGWPSIRVRLIKVKTKDQEKDIVFMTNMPEGLIKNKEAGELYQRRWGVESSFRDITETLKLCQWHTTKYDGLLQEIYALLWLVNNVRKLTSCAKKMTSKQWLHRRYKKANFKFVVTVFVDNLELLIKRRYQKLRELLSYCIYRSIETREHLSRSYPRQVKRFGKKYKNASRVPRRAEA